MGAYVSAVQEPTFSTEDVVASSPAQNRDESADSYHLSSMMSVLSGKVLSASWQLLTAFSSRWLHCEIVPDIYPCS